MVYTGKETAEKEIAEVRKAICLLEESTLELKRLRRLLGEAGKLQSQDSRQALKSTIDSRTSYIG